MIHAQRSALVAPPKVYLIAGEKSDFLWVPKGRLSVNLRYSASKLCDLTVIMSSVGAPQQHKQASRKGKKAWRKNVDVTDVQDGLEIYQEEVRAGGPLHEKDADELFALDTTGSKEIVKKYNVGKPLKVDEILAKRSAIPAVDTRKRGGFELGSGVYEPASKRRKGDWVSKKDVQRLKKTINTVSHIGDEAGDQAGTFDLWDAQPVAAVADDLDYIPKPKAKVAPTTLKLQPNAITANGKPVKPVPNPKAGSSYNPDYEEWNEAIVREGDREVEAEKLRLKAEQVEAERLARIEAAAAEEQGYRTEDESAWEGFETENEDVEGLKMKRPSRKTPAERNKIKRRKEAERLAKHEKKMADKKKVGQELARMVLSGQLVPVESDDAVDNLQVEADVEDSESGDDTKLRRRKLGPIMVPEKNLEIVLPEELQDSLRRLKPEGNLLQDRFRNLLVNGKLESRKPITQAKKRKVKVTEKWTYKDFSIPV